MVDEGTDDPRAMAVPTAGSRAWLVRGSSVGGVNVVPQWLADGFVSVAASRLRSVEPDSALADLRVAVDQDYAHLSYNQRSAKLAELHAFLNRMSVGDLLVTTAEGVVHIGRVDGEPEQTVGDPQLTVRRPAQWERAVDFTELPATLQARLRSSANVVDLTEVVDQVAALRPVERDAAAVVVTEARLPDLPAAKVAELLVGKEFLTEFVELLRERRQVILHGPPGTGKTYLALEVAGALTDPANVTLVQFHPAYSYEDFFEGYRPAPVDESGRVGFELRPGPFRKLVDQARSDPGTPYILIIDEINRANLAKVFGELYFLLEYRDRPIDLMYSSGDEGRDFTLPANVYLIGTMNTADRSIALVDAAMRRRFAFLSMHPQDPHLADLLADWLAARDRDDRPARLLAALNERISDRDYRIGPSYLMNESSATDLGLERIWRTSILPLLEEHHVGDGIDVERRYGLPALRRAMAPADEAVATDEP